MTHRERALPDRPTRRSGSNMVTICASSVLFWRRHLFGDVNVLRTECVTDWVVGRLVSGVSFSQNPETIFVLGPGAIGTAAHSVGQSVGQGRSANCPQKYRALESAAAHSGGRVLRQSSQLPPRHTETRQPLRRLQHTALAGFNGRAANCFPDIQRRGSTGDGCSTQRWPGSTAEQPTDSQT